MCALTLVGVVVLGYSPYARARSVFWRIGASLHRLLPIIELSEEFTYFFDTTKSKPGEPRKLFRWQMAFFAVFGLTGWILGLLLLGAMGVLTPK